MLKRALVNTNPYLRDPLKRREMFRMTVYTSTGIEGVKLEPEDLDEKGISPARSAANRESAKSSESRR